jgi:hypothetical protein
MSYLLNRALTIAIAGNHSILVIKPRSFKLSDYLDNVKLLEPDIKYIDSLYQSHINLIHENDSLNNYIKKPIVLGNTKTTGKVILDSPKGKVISYIIFVLVIAVGIFFIIEKRHGKDKTVNKGGFLRKRK